jgi:hypothetical protein
MNFLKKLRFWKRRRNGAVTRNIATTDNRNSETGNQVSSIEMILRCHAGTRVDSILTCEVSTQTSNVNERPQNRTDSGAAENGKEEMKSKAITLKKLLGENDSQIWKQNEIQEMNDKEATSNSSKRRK